jgi:hypothetical protein
MRVQAAAVAAAGLLALGAAGCASTIQAGSGGPAGSGSGISSASGASGGTGTTSGPSIGGTASSPAPTGAVEKAAAAACPTNSVSPLTNPAAKPVPTGIQVAWVLRCRVVSGGTKSTLVAERSTSDPTELVRALQEPSVPRLKVVCPMIAVYIPNFALVESNGQLLVPKLPVNNCGMPQSDVVAALNLMHFSQISSRPLK